MEDYALNVNGEEGLTPGSIFLRGVRSIRPFEAYATNSDPNAARYLPIVDMNGEASNINANIYVQPLCNEKWYTLDGRNLSSKPGSKGVYIVNGIKVIIK